MHLSLATMHLSLATMHLSLATMHLSLATMHLSLATMQLSLATMHLSLATMQLPCYRSITPLYLLTPPVLSRWDPAAYRAGGCICLLQQMRNRTVPAPGNKRGLGHAPQGLPPLVPRPAAGPVADVSFSAAAGYGADRSQDPMQAAGSNAAVSNVHTKSYRAFCDVILPLASHISTLPQTTHFIFREEEILQTLLHDVHNKCPELCKDRSTFLRTVESIVFPL
jgi:hypothetical protein